MFRFSPAYVSDVRDFFGTNMSPRLQEYLDDHDHASVLTYLRGSHKWPTKDVAIDAILTLDHVSLMVAANHERRLCELEAAGAMELIAYSEVLSVEHVRA